MRHQFLLELIFNYISNANFNSSSELYSLSSIDICNAKFNSHYLDDQHLGH